MPNNPREIKTTKDAAEIVKSRNLKHVKVGVFDIDGILRGKYMSADKFLSSLENGFGFCDVVMGWDVKDQLYDNVDFTGWHTAYPDANVRLIPESCRPLPFEDDGLLFLAEFEGPAESVCPRGVLRRVLKRAKDLGLEIDCGFEYEFFVFNETPHSIREKGFENLEPFTPGEFGYSVIRNSVEAETYQNILTLSETMDFPLEGLHEETGPGVLEAAITHGSALESADKAALFKTFTKIALQREQKLATFMAKWSPDYPGQSGHIHLSILSDKGENLFFDKSKDGNRSELMEQFVAGQQKLMPEFLAMIAPTINSYRRLIPGFWAPTHASVGVDNRTCAIRLIPGSEKSQRIEYRIAAADANPYVILAAVIASGLYGVEQKLKPAKLTAGNAYEETFPKELELPKTLFEAAQLLKSSTPANDYFGKEFTTHFAKTREWEEREFRKHISKWELERYFEII